MPTLGIDPLIPLPNLVPEGLSLPAPYNSVSSDGGEWCQIVTTSADTRFPYGLPYRVYFESVTTGTTYLSPRRRMTRLRELWAVVPRMPQGLYEVSVYLGALDGSTATNTLKVYNRGQFQAAYSTKQGLPGSWDAGPRSAKDDDATGDSYDSRFSHIMQISAEMTAQVTGRVAEGETVLAEDYTAGDDEVAVVSVYPLLGTKKFSLGKKTIYSFTTLDADGTPHLVGGVHIVQGTDGNVPAKSTLWPIR